MLRHNQSSVQGYFLCYYIPSKQDSTPVSSLLLKFKNNESESIIDNFCKWACQELEKEGIQIQVIVRSLSNNETEAINNTSLDELGRKLAKYLNAIYCPELIKKTRKTYPLKKIAFESRKSEIDNIYFSGISSDISSVLIIDDIYTTGATVNDILRAIKEVNPMVSAHIFTLGKTTFDPNKNERITMPDFIYKQNQEYPDRFEDMVIEYSLA